MSEKFKWEIVKSSFNDCYENRNLDLTNSSFFNVIFKNCNLKLDVLTQPIYGCIFYECKFYGGGWEKYNKYIKIEESHLIIQIEKEE